MNIKTQNAESKVITNPSIARALLQKGNNIIDIKPNKNNVRETVFIFENTDKLKNDLTSITK